MKMKSKILNALALSSLLLGWAGTATAREIVVEYVTSTLSALAPLTGSDNITVRNGGILFVDVSGVTIGNLTIGEASGSPGTVSFPGSYTLTVATNVTFGADANSLLDMSVALTTPTLKVGGKFLASGSGRFFAGSGTVEYNGTAPQTVTAQIGGSGTLIQYKDLVLSTNGLTPSGPSTKTFAAGLSIQGLLDIRDAAKPAGAPASYGSLARLQYSGTPLPGGTGAQTTSVAEWPASMNAQITINNTAGVVLDGDKLLGAGGAYANVLVVNSGCALKDGGKTLTVQGNISNSGSLEGKGKLVLGGSSAQTLSGAANAPYGNVTLNNAAGASLSGSGTVIRGRLIIQAGKLTLPVSGTHTAALLTYGGADKPAGSYSVGFPPGASVYFDGLGSLGVPSKPTAVLDATGPAPTLTYGTSGVTISGTVSPPAGSPPGTLGPGDFGNGAVDGELVQVTIATSPNPISTIATITGGAFNATFSATGLSVGTSVGVGFTYPGGDNLAGNTKSPATQLTVIPRPITIIPANVNKTYNKDGPDPALTYTYSPPDALVSGSGDYVAGQLSRVSGVNVGAYDITQNTITIANPSNPNAAANYSLTFDNTKKLTILQKNVTVLINSTTKTYGDVDPAFTATFVPALLTGDTASGSLVRAAGSSFGSYAITQGTFTAGPNYSQSFTSGNLVINKKDLQVDFGNTNKVYGDPDPELTKSAPGLVPGDSLTGTPSRDGAGTTAGEQVSGSPYIIRPNNLSLGDKAGNYNVTYTTTGKLTISKRSIGVAAISPPKTYGDDLPALASYSTFFTAGQTWLTLQTAPVTLPSITWGSQGTATKCSLPGPYGYTVNADAADPNHSFTTPSPNVGTLQVNAKNLTIRPDNKTKVADGNLFDYSAYTVSYNTFVCSDTIANSLQGFLSYSGDAISATAAGVYPIIPSGLSPNSLGKYSVINANGYLVITATPGTTSSSGDTWAGGGSRAWMINDPTGTAGGSSGWSLLNITGSPGTLTINASSANKYRLDLVTMIGNAAGRMPKFDPTRPYSWQFVKTANGITLPADPLNSVFDINYNGTALFSNPVWGGTFSVRQSQDGKSLMLDYTPVGTDRNVASGVLSQAPTVPDSYNVFPVLQDMVTSDRDVIWLQPSSTNIAAGDTLTINVNVSNLKQPIVGVDAFINFSSAHYIATNNVPGAPQVVAGGGVWDTMIYKLWSTNGDMDTVIAVNLTAQAGTSADATVAKITLTPTKTKTGASRVVFRVDGLPVVDTNSSATVQTDLQPAGSDTKVLPARIMTPAISIATDTTGPVLDKTTMTATQDQPHSATGVNVKGGDSDHRTEVVRTAGSGALAAGPVVITIPCTDAGVGLFGSPELTLYQSSPASNIVVACKATNAAAGTFTYEWTVPVALPNGTWTAKVTAKDTILPTPNSKTVDPAFTLSVNTREISGVVELQSFKGTTRQVTFNIGDNDGANANSVRTYTPTLTFTSGLILNAGGFQDRAKLAGKIKAPSEFLSAYLAYGSINNVGLVAGKLKGSTLGIDVYIHKLLYGYITDVDTLANKLTSPVRAVDSYIMGRLSSATILALANYKAAKPADQWQYVPAVTQGLLDDFNTTIVLGPSIYDPVRFASVTLVHTPNPTPSPAPTGNALIELNRNLLWDVYNGQFVRGYLMPQTAQRLSQYVSGADTTLAGYLLQEFATLAITSSLWPSASAPFAQCLYNEQLFVGTTLQPATASLLNQHRASSPLSALEVIRLNQLLLQDAYPGGFERPPLAPGTVDAARNFDPASPQAFETAMITDLNAMISRGSSIMDVPDASYLTSIRFAPWVGQIDPAGELGQLLAIPNKTAAQLIRQNRLLLELGYVDELSKGVLAQYRLVQVLAQTVEVTAKAAWNLRERLAPSFDPVTLAATANFVNDGVPLWQDAADHYLRGGDLQGDNVVDLADYNKLRTVYGTTNPAGDINGDGVVNILDYSLMQVNWARSGDADAK